jgi:hypothetical protein
MTKPLFEAFRDSTMRKPTGSRKEALDHFVETMKSDPAYFDLLANDYFDRMAAVWTVRTENHGYSFGRTLPSRDKVERMSGPRDARLIEVVEVGIEHEADAAAETTESVIAPEEMIERRRQAREETAARSAEAYAKMRAVAVANIILLNQALPDGTMVRDATGAKMVRAGKWFADVGKSIKPTQVVGRHLSEANLRDIFARYFQRNETKVA